MKAKINPKQAMKALRGVDAYPYSFFKLGFRGVGDQSNATSALPMEKSECPLITKPDRPQGQFGRVLNISPPQGFDPRTVQPVASRYID